MAAKKKNSKKRSQPPEQYTFFLDRCLGRKNVSQMLQEQGELYILHDDQFTQDTPDTVWLNEVGLKGWVVFSKDVRIRKRLIELEALKEAKVAAFILANGNLTGLQIAEAFKHALPQIKRILKRADRPIVATITKSGNVQVYKT